MVVICADNDANGVGQRVRIALPPISELDFNDLLRGGASAPIARSAMSPDPGRDSRDRRTGRGNESGAAAPAHAANAAGRCRHP
jgi:hypothetical protein